MLKVGSRVLRDRKKQAEALNCRFATQGEERAGDDFDKEYKSSIDRAIAQFDFSSESKMEQVGVNSHITLDEVENEINRMGTFKAPGPDLIHPIFLKKGGYQVRKTLTIILKASFLLGKLPYIWRVALITNPAPTLRFSVLFLF